MNIIAGICYYQQMLCCYRVVYNTFVFQQRQCMHRYTSCIQHSPTTAVQTLNFISPAELRSMNWLLYFLSTKLLSIFC